MGNFFEDLGGVLFGTGGTKTTSSQQPTMTPEQLALFNTLVGQAQTGVNTATPSYPYQSYADTNAIEQQYMDTATGKKKTIANEALLNVLSGKPAYEVNPEATEKYYQESIRQPALKEFKETTMPLLTESYTGPSFWSSARGTAQDKAIQNLTDTLTTQHGQLLYADEQARRTALENAVGRQAQVAPTVNQNEINNLGTAGAYARQIENEKIASNMARWLSGESLNGTSISAYNPNTQLALTLLGVQPFTYAQSSTTTGKGILSSLLGGTGSAIGQGIGSKIME